MPFFVVAHFLFLNNPYQPILLPCVIISLFLNYYGAAVNVHASVSEEQWLKVLNGKNDYIVIYLMVI